MIMRFDNLVIVGASRGVGEAVSKHLISRTNRQDRIAVTVINPGDIGTPEVLSDLKAAGKPAENAIPLADLLSVIDCILSLSRSTCIKEIQLPAMRGKGA